VVKRPARSNDASRMVKMPVFGLVVIIGTLMAGRRPPRLCRVNS